jgi:hypothetical protein
MATLPYITSPRNIEKALKGIRIAALPDRVSQDFVKKMLKIPGGSGDKMTAFLKKINFSSGDGKPTELYGKFRNPASSGKAVAQAIQYAYAPLYLRNESMHDLSDDELLGLIVEETGQAHDSNPVKLTVSCIKALKTHADFSEQTDQPVQATTDSSDETSKPVQNSSVRHAALLAGGNPGLNLAYTINLNLPPTSDQAVFNAIFRSLKQNLLSEDDA